MGHLSSLGGKPVLNSGFHHLIWISLTKKDQGITYLISGTYNKQIKRKKKMHTFVLFTG